MDESGFYLLACLVATYAPRGQTPILEVPLSRDHLSVMGALTLTGKLYTCTREKSFNSLDVIDFLAYLLAKIDGKIVIVWDGGPIHKSKAVKEFLASEASARIQIEQLPAYAPLLNPVEYLWRYLKYVEMKNLCCLDLEHLFTELVKARERIRHKKHVLHACLEHAGCFRD